MIGHCKSAVLKASCLFISMAVAQGAIQDITMNPIFASRHATENVESELFTGFSIGILCIISSLDAVDVVHNYACTGCKFEVMDSLLCFCATGELSRS